MHKTMIPNASLDTESQNSHEFHMSNDLVHSLSWSNMTLTVEDRSTNQPKDLVAGVSGRIEAGKYPSTSLVDDRMTNVI
jgi:hypothetical protein